MSRCRQCVDRLLHGPLNSPPPAATQDCGRGPQNTARQEEEEEAVPEYHVRVDGYAVARHGNHVVYSITVSRGNAWWPIRRRFRQVMNLHSVLVRGLGRGSAIGGGLPRPPPRVTCGRLFCGARDSRVLAARAMRLQAYLEALLRYIPYVDQCEALSEFLCSVDVGSMSYEALLDLGQALGRAPSSEPPVTTADIEALPRRARGSNEAGGAAAAAVGSDGGGCCVICQDALEVDDDGDDTDIVVLPCGHEYHYKCIAQWIPHCNKCCVCQGVAVIPTAAVASEAQK